MHVSAPGHPRKGEPMRTIVPTRIRVVDENDEDSQVGHKPFHIPCYTLEVEFADPKTGKTLKARCNSSLIVQPEE